MAGPGLSCKMVNECVIAFTCDHMLHVQGSLVGCRCDDEVTVYKPANQGDDPSQLLLELAIKEGSGEVKLHSINTFIYSEDGPHAADYRSVTLRYKNDDAEETCTINVGAKEMEKG